QTAHGQTVNGRMASRERWAASGDAGEVEATAAPMAQAAEDGPPGEAEAINQMASGRTASRERRTAVGGQGRMEAPPALAQRAAQAGGAIRLAEAVSLAPTERTLAPCRQPR